MSKLSTYLAITKNAFIKNLEYRAKLILWITLSIFPVTVMIITWQQIMTNSDRYSLDQLTQIIQYYLLILFISQISATYLERWITQKIKKGDLNFFLLKPISFFKYLFFDLIGRKINFFVLFLPLWLIFYFFVSKIYPFNYSLSLIDWLQFIILLCFNFAIEFSLSLVIVNLAFWLEEAGSLMHFKELIISLFSGAMMPLEFLPNWLNNISNLLPFKYMYYVPIMIFQKKINLTLHDYSQMVITLIILYIIIKILWKLGIKKYSSVGG